MNTTYKVIFTVATLIIVLGCLGLAVWSIFAHQLILGLTCLMLGLGFGYFLYNDFKSFRKS